MAKRGKRERGEKRDGRAAIECRSFVRLLSTPHNFVCARVERATSRPLSTHARRHAAQMARLRFPHLRLSDPRKAELGLFVMSRVGVIDPTFEPKFPFIVVCCITATYLAVQGGSCTPVPKHRVPWKRTEKRRRYEEPDEGKNNLKNKIQTAIAAEAAVEKKVTWIRNDQERRVLALEERQDKMLRHAQLAEAWADEVEKVSVFVP